MKRVTINPVLNGWKVKVGCSEVVFTDKLKMLQELGRYIEKPDDVEKEYVNNSVNNSLVPELDCDTPEDGPMRNMTATESCLERSR